MTEDATPDTTAHEPPSRLARWQRAFLRMLTTATGDNPSPAGPRSVARPASARAVARRAGKRGTGNTRYAGQPSRAKMGRPVRHLLPMDESMRGPKAVTPEHYVVKNAQRRADRQAARDRRIAAKDVARGMSTRGRRADLVIRDDAP